LTQQVDAIVGLNQSMPPHLLQANGAVIDLSNFRRPEIQIPIKPPANTMNN
jgi:cell division protein FtsQ